jgi:hypothetical protein
MLSRFPVAPGTLALSCVSSLLRPVQGPMSLQCPSACPAAQSLRCYPVSRIPCRLIRVCLVSTATSEHSRQNRTVSLAAFPILLSGARPYRAGLS